MLATDTGKKSCINIKNPLGPLCFSLHLVPYLVTKPGSIHCIFLCTKKTSNTFFNIMI